MNFLAHIYLSGDNPDVIFGNFIGDFVRGSQFKGYSEIVQKGILLHRFIDEYTDHHELVKAQKMQLRPHFRKYAGVALDVYFDYFLAKYWKNYDAQSLRDYANQFYELTNQRVALLPERGARFHKFMIEYDIIYQYRTKKGMSQVFNGMARRSSFNSGMENAAKVLEIHEEEMAETFRQFFPDLITASRNFRKNTLSLEL